MQFDKDFKNGSDSNPDGGRKEENFSFLQETIKPEPVTKKKIINRLLKLAGCGIILGVFSCLSFYALKPWVQDIFPESPTTVTIPEDVEETVDAEKEDQDKTEPIQTLNAENYEEMMDSIYKIAKDARKSVVTVQAEKETSDWMSEENHPDTGNTGLIAADNGQELLILADNSICTDASNWTVLFADGSAYQAELKQQDKNTHFAVFSVKRNEISSETWESVQVAVLGNSNIAAAGDAVIAIGDTFGYHDGIGYGIISSNEYEEMMADHTFRVIATDIASADESTGVLCNLKGEIIGLIDSQIWSANGGNTANAFAISDLKPTMELLLNGESVPYVGIFGVTVDEKISEEKGIPIGVYVTQIRADSPAMAAGIQSGDILQEIEGLSVSTVQSYEKAVQNSKTGDSIKIKGKRLGAEGYVEISFDVTVGSQE